VELLAKAPDPARAAKLTRAQVSAALKRARRRGIPDKATAILAALRSPQLGQPSAVTAAYAATIRSLIAMITTLNEQVKTLGEEAGAHFGRHPDAEIYRSQPGMGAILGARVPGEFGDDPHRYASGKARKNHAATCLQSRVILAFPVRQPLTRSAPVIAGIANYIARLGGPNPGNAVTAMATDCPVSGAAQRGPGPNPGNVRADEQFQRALVSRATRAGPDPGNSSSRATWSITP
jgi:hypothetical protein